MDRGFQQPSSVLSYRTVLLIFIAGYAYALIRYIIAGPVAWSDAPLFVLNKGFAFTAIVLFSLNMSLTSLQERFPSSSFLRRIDRKIWTAAGLTLIILHTLTAFILFNPEYFGEFFATGKRLSLSGSFSLLGGVVSFTALLYSQITGLLSRVDGKAEKTFVLSRIFTRISIFFLSVHLICMGYAGWLNPGSWHAHLPPVSLLSFLFLCAGGVLNIRRRRQ